MRKLHLGYKVALIACGVGIQALLLSAPAVSLAAITSTHAGLLQKDKTVTLTFDDGPYGTSTQQVLDILQQEHVHATFFLIGKNVEQYPLLAKEIVQNGNVVGNYTYDHPKNLTRMAPTQVEEELSKTELAIASSTGVHATLFRPAYGNITKTLRSELTKDGYTTVLWNVDPMDWNYASSTSSIIVKHILDHLKSTMVIVLHDGRDTQVGYPRDNLIAGLPIVIEDLKQRGYTFITADRLSSVSN